MPMLEWAEDWRNYALGPLTGSAWNTAGAPTLLDGGRNGKRYVNWSQNGISRSGSASYIYGVYRVDSGGNVVTPQVAVQGFIGSSLTSSNWLMGGAWNGWPYCGIVATEDGALHVHRGGAFARGPNSQDTSIVASSEGGVIPIGRGWFFLEATFVWRSDMFGEAQVYVNGNRVILYEGPTTYPFDYCQAVLGLPPGCLDDWPNANQVIVGRATRGAISFQGWTGAIDLIASFTPSSPTDTLGTDFRIEDLIPTADGATVESTIAGTSPAPTRWQSVDDLAANDGAVTTVAFDKDTVTDLDEYVLSAFPYPSATIYGVQAVVDLRTSVPGYADIQLGVKNGAGTLDTSQRQVRSNIFNRFAAAAPEKPGGGAWDVAALSGLNVRFQRKV